MVLLSDYKFGYELAVSFKGVDFDDNKMLAATNTEVFKNKLKNNKDLYESMAQC